MSTKFSMTRDINGYNGFGLMPCDDKFGMNLITGAPQTVTVPDNHQVWVAIFMLEPGDSVWVAYNATATIPSSTVAACNCELNPPAWRVLAGDTISFATTDASITVGVKFYAIV